MRTIFEIFAVALVLVFFYRLVLLALRQWAPQLIEDVNRILLAPRAISLPKFGIARSFHTLSQHPASEIFLLFLWNRTLIFLIAYFSFIIIHQVGFGFFDHFQKIWHRWDVDSFIFIAENWYVSEGNDRNRIAFYPFYPITIHLANYITGNSFVSGTLLSLVYLFLACLVLHKLVLHETNNDTVAKRSVKFLLLYPFSYFASMVYSEGLFLLLTISCFYCIRRQWWWWAGSLGFLAALTKNQGVLLALPMAFEILRLHCANWKETRSVDCLKLLKHAGITCLVPAGILVYLIINYDINGDFFSFVSIQKENWHQSFGFFAGNIGDAYDRLSDRGVRFALGVSAPTLVVFFCSMLLLIWGALRVPPAYLLYSIAMLLISFSPTWLLSAPRYVLSIFPLFIILSLWVHNKPKLEQAVEQLLSVSLTLSCIYFIYGIVY